MESLKELEDRFKKYNLNEHWTSATECCFFGVCYHGFKPMTDKEVATYIFNGWLNSPEHRKNMLSKEAKYGACSTIVKKIVQINKYTDGRVVKNKVTDGFSTLDLY